MSNLFKFTKHFLVFQSRNFKSSSINMSLKLSGVVNKLQQFAPLSLAEKWDNVGLLVDPLVDKPIQSILLTNDLTEDVVQEAVDNSNQLIITYHPNIFKGLTSVTGKTWKERVVVKCIKNEIAVYSPHTTWDVVEGGVNDWLASVFDYETKQPIVPHENNPTYGVGRILKLKSPITICSAVEKMKLHIFRPFVRLGMAKNAEQDSLIETVALCAGSGASALNGVKADLYLTGEMLHHDVLDACQKGITVILCNHSDSERGYLKLFKEKLTNQILNKNIIVNISNIDCDPLVSV